MRKTLLDRRCEKDVMRKTLGERREKINFKKDVLRKTLWEWRCEKDVVRKALWKRCDKINLKKDVVRKTLWEKHCRLRRCERCCYILDKLNNIFSPLVSLAALQKHFACDFISNHAYISIFISNHAYISILIRKLIEVC